MGQILAITGSNGMGKTTLMKTMGLLDAREGKIFTKTMILLPEVPVRSKLGIEYVPQGRNFLIHLLLNKILCYRFILERN